MNVSSWNKDMHRATWLVLPRRLFACNLHRCMLTISHVEYTYSNHAQASKLLSNHQFLPDRGKRGSLSQGACKWLQIPHYLPDWNNDNKYYTTTATAAYFFTATKNTTVLTIPSEAPPSRQPSIVEEALRKWREIICRSACCLEASC